jgi:hypothetical protein
VAKMAGAPRREGFGHRRGHGHGRRGRCRDAR